MDDPTKELERLKLQLEIERLKASIAEIKGGVETSSIFRKVLTQLTPEAKDTLVSLAALAQAHIKANAPK